MGSKLPTPHGAGSPYAEQLRGCAYAVLMGLTGLAQTVLAAELIDPAARINDFLLPRVERVARRTHFDQQVLAQGRAGREFVAATTGHIDVVVVGMNVGFHWRSPV